jgi:hypothetical protein
MLKIPTALEPAEAAFNFILACIREHLQHTRVAAIGPHLANFIADLIIQEILTSDADHVEREDQLKADQEPALQVTLKTINSLIQSIQKQLDKLASSKGNPPNKGNKGNSKPPQKTFSAM